MEETIRVAFSRQELIYIGQMAAKRRQEYEALANASAGQDKLWDSFIEETKTIEDKVKKALARDREKTRKYLIERGVYHRAGLTCEEG